MRLIPRLIAVLAAVGLSACATPTASQPQTSAPVAVAQQEAFVIAANPLAAQAGLEVLRRGGSAVDAAIAVQAMLSLVEPQSSGLGGGAFMNYYDARTGKVIDLRRTRGRAGAGGVDHVPARRRQAAAVRGGGAERPRDRRSGRVRMLADGASRARQAAVEQPVRRRRADRARRLHRQPASRPAGARRLSRRTGRRTSSPISRSRTERWSRPATGCAIRPMRTSSGGSPRRDPRRSTPDRPRRRSSRGPAPRRSAGR